MTDNKEVKQSNPNTTKDGLALVVGGLFILALVFAAYNYFSKGVKFTQNKVENEKINFVDDLKKDDKEENKDNKDQAKGDLNGDGAKDVKTQPQTDNKPNTTVTTPNTTVTSSTGATGAWKANDYKQGDIKTGSYTVKSGDTLWELAEGAYGNGADWVKILNANKGSIGYLPNGEQALIKPGQVLVLP